MNNKIKELIFSNEDYLLNYNNTVKYFKDFYFTTKTEQYNFNIDNKEYVYDFLAENEIDHILGVFVSDYLSEEDFLNYAKKSFSIKPYPANVFYVVKLHKKSKINYPILNLAMNERQWKTADIKVVEISFDNIGRPVEHTLYFSSEQYHPYSFYYNPEERPKDEAIEFFSNSVEKTKINPLYQTKDESLLSFDLEIVDKGTKSLMTYFERVNDFKIKGELDNCFSAQESNISKHFYLITETTENLALIQSGLFKYVREQDRIRMIKSPKEKETADIIFTTATVESLKSGRMQTFFYKIKEDNVEE